jgi:hypothetical protein
MAQELFKGKIIKQHEQVNHPTHYNQYDIETIEMIVRIWGNKRASEWCEITAFKYRMRLGLKDNFEQDLLKENWYINKAKELKQ